MSHTVNICKYHKFILWNPCWASHLLHPTLTFLCFLFLNVFFESYHILFLEFHSPYEHHAQVFWYLHSNSFLQCKHVLKHSNNLPKQELLFDFILQVLLLVKVLKIGFFAMLDRPCVNKKKTKHAVFPVPDWLWTMTSLPLVIGMIALY